MKITIEYESSWRNIFSEGSNNEPVGKNGRSYIASGKNLNDFKKSTYQDVDVTKNTIRGILNRLLGDRRKLHQIIDSEYNYFEDIDEKISFLDKPRTIDNEIVFLRNINNSDDPSCFSGFINTDSPAFMSVQGKLLWAVLKLDFETAVNYIRDRHSIDSWESTADQVYDLFEDITKINKTINYKKSDDETVSKYREISNLVSYYIKDSKNHESENFNFKFFYSDLLRIQMIFLEEEGYDFSEIKTKQGKLPGVNPSGITYKNFMSKYTSGGTKVVHGNPYIVTSKNPDLKGKALKKVSGTLVIDIDVDRNRAKEIKNLIENAGVLTFKVGKKSVAYIKKIKV